jgi:4-amino-4-deoxy-L-arabinose transferase-like glycosyltransferase
VIESARTRAFRLLAAGYGLRTADYGLLSTFLVSLIALFALRGRALWTPYFWDEVGYYVPNAVSMYRNHLYPIPDLTVPQSYPPLQPLLLVVGWWSMGFSIAAARIVGFVEAAAALACTYALGREVFSPAVGVAAAALAFASPVFFGQTGFAQPEVLLALFTAAATLALVRGRSAWHAAAVALMLMTKWTSIVALPAFGLYALLTARSWREGLARQLAYLPGLGLLGVWLGFFYAKTGSFTSPASHYAQANLWDNLTVPSLVFRGAVRLEQLAVNDLAWVLLAPMLVAGAAWFRDRASRYDGEDRVSRNAVLLMVGVCACYVAFLTVSGFLLPRYFVPVQPLFSVLGAAAVYRLWSRPVATAAVVATALVMHLGWYGRFPTGPALLDGRTAYMDFVEAHVRAARWLETNAPGARVAATWPAVDELHDPIFGYVTRPVATVSLDALLEGDAALDRFDVLYESPVPQSPDPARDLAERLGLVELTRFTVGEHVTVLWGHPPGSGSPRRTPEAPPR